MFKSPDLQLFAGFFLDHFFKKRAYSGAGSPDMPVSILLFPSPLGFCICSHKANADPAECDNIINGDKSYLQAVVSIVFIDPDVFDQVSVRYAVDPAFQLLLQFGSPVGVLYIHVLL